MTTDLQAEATAQNERIASLIAVIDRTNLDDVRSSWELDIINDFEHGRWEAILNEDTVAELTYRFVGGRIVLLSTWVAHPYRQQRVATELIARVLNEIRGTGKKVTIICPVVGEFISRNPEYADLIDDVHPGSGSRPHGPEAGDEDEQLTAFETDLG
jgi:predicted GNAT family acetyltransferase